MLDREGKLLNVQEVSLTQETVDVDRQGMCSQLGVQTSTQSGEGVSVRDFEVELLGQLTIHRLNDLASTVDQGSDQLLHKDGHLVEGVMLLVAAGQRYESDVVVTTQLLGQVLVNEAFVRHNVQVGVPPQQRCTCLLIRHIGPNQLEVEECPTQRSKQMQLIPEDGPLLGADTSKGSAITQPFAS